MDFEDKFAFGTIVFMACVFLLSAGGWIANIIKLVSMGFDPITIELVARIVGIFMPPLGVIMGYL